MIKHVYNENTDTKITNVDEKSIQPNAVDLRIGKIERLNDDGVFILREDGKTHMNATEIFADSNGMYNLPVGYYRVTFDHRIKVGGDECGWTIPRSTLVRNGVLVYTALYDSGYEGSMICGLQVTTGTARIQAHARIAQYICSDCETIYLYNGSYQEKK